MIPLNNREFLINAVLACQNIEAINEVIRAARQLGVNDTTFHNICSDRAASLRNRGSVFVQPRSHHVSAVGQQVLAPPVQATNPLPEINRNNLIPNLRKVYSEKGNTFALFERCNKYLTAHYGFALTAYEKPIACFLSEKTKFNDLINILFEIKDLVDDIQLQGSHFLTKDDLLNFYQLFGDKVAFFRITKDNRNVTDDSFLEIIKACPNIVCVEVSGQPSLTDRCLSELHRSIKLTFLDIRDCDLISHIPKLENIQTLQRFAMTNCPKFTVVPKFHSRTDQVGFFNMHLTNVDNLPENATLVQTTYSPEARIQLVKKDLFNPLSVVSHGLSFTNAEYIDALNSLDDREFVSVLRVSLGTKLLNYPSVIEKVIHRYAKLDREGYWRHYTNDFNPGVRELINRLYPAHLAENVILHPVIARQYGGLLNLWMPLHKASQDPYDVLRTLSQFEDIREMRIAYHQGVGIDAHGLRRQFIGELFAGFCQNECEFLKFVPQSDEKSFPYLKKTELTEIEKKQLMTIGKLLAFVANSGGEYLTGEVLSEHFFNILVNLKEADLVSGNIQNLFALYEPMMDQVEKNQVGEPFAAILSMNRAQEMTPQLIDALELLGYVDKGNKTYQQVIESINFQAVKAEFVRDQQEKMVLKLKPLLHIAQGFQNALPIDSALVLHNWDMVRSVNPRVLDQVVQGFLTKDGLKGLIRVDEHLALNPVALTQSHLRVPMVTRELVITWFNEWIDTHSLPEIRQVVKAITGGPNVSLPIKLMITDSSDMVPHTCFRSLDIPRRIGKEEFMLKLNLWAQGVDNSQFTLS